MGACVEILARAAAPALPHLPPPAPILLLLLQLAQLVTSALLAGNVPTAASLLATVFVTGGTCAQAVADGGVWVVWEGV